ncbi:nucleotide exchange factor GrpE [Wolbachia endosymbiont of Howardula sp.]|uniref:nucleotide exchange factor GrpE n=1 Tax=Wolbachia endosymbiont of Howardula sp. TaxID=2916816 RepID=UPI00217DB428|nr:nucleotide exchange factor GrpE [Wolbachia endosymbiont of Howardula sp.]UWI82958.1 nucleotide exchange factor GrpE [Wolbachia endosymbiont of Howardula sp.]
MSNSVTEQKEQYTSIDTSIDTNIDTNIDTSNESENKDQYHTDNIHKKLNEDFNVLKERASQLEDHLRRAIADNENVKRIMHKQINDASDYACTKFARDMIESCDNLKKIMENLQENDPIHEGIKVAYQKIMNDFKKYDIEEIYPLGQYFDSNLHQAIMEREDSKETPGTIIEILQTGYTIKNRLLRPAMVIIAKKIASPE